jgi:hypothetical protein
MTDMLLGVEAAGKVYASRAKTIVLAALHCSLLVVVHKPTPSKLTSAFRDLHEQTNVQGRYSNAFFLERVETSAQQSCGHCVPQLPGRLGSAPQGTADLRWNGVPAHATIFHVN